MQGAALLRCDATPAPPPHPTSVLLLLLLLRLPQGLEDDQKAKPAAKFAKPILTAAASPGLDLLTTMMPARALPPGDAGAGAAAPGLNRFLSAEEGEGDGEEAEDARLQPGPPVAKTVIPPPGSTIGGVDKALGVVENALVRGGGGAASSCSGPPLQRPLHAHPPPPLAGGRQAGHGAAGACEGAGLQSCGQRWRPMQTEPPCAHACVCPADCRCSLRLTRTAWRWNARYSRPRTTRRLGRATTGS